MTGRERDRDARGRARLAQVCVALTHAARGNTVGAERLFERAGDRLAAFAATGRDAYGVDVAEAVRRARDHTGTF